MIALRALHRRPERGEFAADLRRFARGCGDPVAPVGLELRSCGGELSLSPDQRAGIVLTSTVIRPDLGQLRGDLRVFHLEGRDDRLVDERVAVAVDAAPAFGEE